MYSVPQFRRLLHTSAPRPGRPSLETGGLKGLGSSSGVGARSRNFGTEALQENLFPARTRLGILKAFRV